MYVGVKSSFSEKGSLREPLAPLFSLARGLHSCSLPLGRSSIVTAGQQAAGAVEQGVQMFVFRVDSNSSDRQVWHWPKGTLRVPTKNASSPPATIHSPTTSQPARELAAVGYRHDTALPLSSAALDTLYKCRSHRSTLYDENMLARPCRGRRGLQK